MEASAIRVQAATRRLRRDAGMVPEGGRELNAMTSSRIKDAGLDARIEEAEIAWFCYVTPITEHYCREISRRDQRGKKLACWIHIRLNDQPHQSVKAGIKRFDLNETHLFWRRAAC
jgi:hypothetical protein